MNLEGAKKVFLPARGLTSRDERLAKLVMDESELFDGRFVFGLGELGGAIRGGACGLGIAAHQFGVDDEFEAPQLIPKVPTAFDAIGEFHHDVFKKRLLDGRVEGAEEREELGKDGQPIGGPEERVQKVCCSRRVAERFERRDSAHREVGLDVGVIARFGEDKMRFSEACRIIQARGERLDLTERVSGARIEREALLVETEGFAFIAESMKELRAPQSEGALRILPHHAFGERAIGFMSEIDRAGAQTRLFDQKQEITRIIELEKEWILTFGGLAQHGPKRDDGLVGRVLHLELDPSELHPRVDAFDDGRSALLEELKDALEPRTLIGFGVDGGEAMDYLSVARVESEGAEKAPVFPAEAPDRGVERGDRREAIDAIATREITELRFEDPDLEDGIVDSIEPACDESEDAPLAVTMNGRKGKLRTKLRVEFERPSERGEKLIERDLDEIRMIENGADRGLNRPDVFAEGSEEKARPNRPFIENTHPRAALSHPEKNFCVAATLGDLHRALHDDDGVADGRA